MKNEIMAREVEFNGDKLMAIEDVSSGKIYVGVSWICSGIGLSKSKRNAQVQKIQSDYVLKQGVLKFQCGVFDENNETTAIELDYLPLWLAKISITPSMQKDNPELAQKLFNYQTQAQKVLAKAFIHNEDINISNFHIPTTLSEALLLSSTLAKENELMKPKSDQFDLYLDAIGTLSWNQVAKELKTGRNKMMGFLRYKKVLNQDNSPSDYYANKEYFVVKGYTIITKDKKKYQVATTRATTKGQSFLYKYLKNNIDEYSQFDSDFKSKILEVFN